MSKKFSIAMYHYTRDLVHTRYSKIKGMDIKEFKEQIEYMINNFHIITMEQVIASYVENEKLPDNALLLTFDDGYIDNYTVAMPILEEYGVQGTFFIPGKTFVEHKLLDVNKIHYILACSQTSELLLDVKNKMEYYRGREFDFPETGVLYDKYAVANRWDHKDVIFVKRMLQTVLPEKLRNKISSELFEKYVGITEEQLAYELYMSEDQIRTMKNHGMFIGIHGYDHYWLGSLTEDELMKDVDKALQVMEPFIDKNNWAMCYPYGDRNDRIINLIKSKGCKLGFTTESRSADIMLDSSFEIPRFDCNDFPPKSFKYLEL